MFTHKLLLFFCSIFALSLHGMESSSQEIPAQTKENLEKLRTTGSCRGCNFSHVSKEFQNALEDFLMTHNRTDVNLEEANLEGIHLEELNVSGSNFSRANFKYAYLKLLVMDNCNFNDTHFNDSLLDRVDASHSSFTNSQFDNATLISFGFLGAVIKNASFKQTKLHNALMDNKTKASNTDFSTIELILPEFCERKALEIMGHAHVQQNPDFATLEQYMNDFQDYLASTPNPPDEVIGQAYHEINAMAENLNQRFNIQQAIYAAVQNALKRMPK